MLRRKFILILAPLVLLLVFMAVAAVWLLQDILRGMDDINSQAWVIVQEVNDLGTTVARVELDLHQIKIGQERHLDPLIDSFESAQQLSQAVGAHDFVTRGESARHYAQLTRVLAQFEKDIAALATAQDPDLARAYTEDALTGVIDLRQAISGLSRLAMQHAQEEQLALATRFRWLVLGLSLVFIVVINVSVLVLMRLASVILRPVDKLVDASRRLALEQFEHRVQLEQSDEFGELAAAYNRLAEQLQANEQRKIETLGHAALTLNHELNNAIAIIELQLRLLSRQGNGSEAHQRCLHQIHDSLERMARTVESLKHVRKIVLTDYIEGVKMLDLPRSVEESRHVEQVSNGSF